MRLWDRIMCSLLGHVDTERVEVPQTEQRFNYSIDGRLGTTTVRRIVTTTCSRCGRIERCIDLNCPIEILPGKTLAITPGGSDAQG